MWTQNVDLSGNKACTVCHACGFKFTYAHCKHCYGCKRPFPTKGNGRGNGKAGQAQPTTNVWGKRVPGAAADPGWSAVVSKARQKAINRANLAGTSEKSGEKGNGKGSGTVSIGSALAALRKEWGPEAMAEVDKVAETKRLEKSANQPLSVTYKKTEEKLAHKLGVVERAKAAHQVAVDALEEATRKAEATRVFLAERQSELDDIEEEMRVAKATAVGQAQPASSPVNLVELCGDVASSPALAEAIKLLQSHLDQTAKDKAAAEAAAATAAAAAAAEKAAAEEAEAKPTFANVPAGNDDIDMDDLLPEVLADLGVGPEPKPPEGDDVDDASKAMHEKALAEHEKSIERARKSLGGILKASAAKRLKKTQRS